MKANQPSNPREIVDQCNQALRQGAERYRLEILEKYGDMKILASRMSSDEKMKKLPWVSGFYKYMSKKRMNITDDEADKIHKIVAEAWGKGEDAQREYAWALVILKDYYERSAQET